MDILLVDVHAHFQMRWIFVKLCFSSYAASWFETRHLYIAFNTDVVTIRDLPLRIPPTCPCDLHLPIKQQYNMTAI